MKNERSHLENQERAYIAASRRTDRSIDARLVSARLASKIHYQRTGRRFRITKEIVQNEEMYEEEEDEHHRRSIQRLNPGLQTDSPELNRRLENYVSTRIEMSQMLYQSDQTWRQNEINTRFDQAFPALSGRTLQSPGILARQPGPASPTATSQHPMFDQTFQSPFSSPPSPLPPSEPPLSPTAAAQPASPAPQFSHGHAYMAPGPSSVVSEPAQPTSAFTTDLPGDIGAMGYTYSSGSQSWQNPLVQGSIFAYGQDDSFADPRDLSLHAHADAAAAAQQPLDYLPSSAGAGQDPEENFEIGQFVNDSLAEPDAQPQSEYMATSAL